MKRVTLAKFMSSIRPKTSILKRHSLGLWAWAVHYDYSPSQQFKNRWIEFVPEALAVCEFDCHKPECQHNQWETCKESNRIHTIPARSR
jgi:hypothetical protein